MQILSEQREPHESRDSLRYTDVEGPGDSEREKVITLADLTENENFEVTQSMELLWKMQADERNVILNSFQDCEYEGFEYNHSEYRWPSLRKRGGQGTITATVPKAGRFFAGVVVYDSPGPEAYEMSVDGEVVGRFAAREDNRRQRLFFASQPLDFKGGERLVLRASSAGSPHIVEDIVLLLNRPPILEPPREIHDLEVGWDWDKECMRATWWSTWPVACTLRCGDLEITEEEYTQNHRLYLDELEPERRYACSVEAAAPDGEAIRSDEVSFFAGEPEAPKGTVDRGAVELSIAGTEGRMPPGYPLTSGIPFPRGALSSTDNLRLVAPDGAEQPLQARPLVRWPDGSVKVALIDTVVPVGLADDRTLVLEHGNDVQRAPVTDAILATEDMDGITVVTPQNEVRFEREASGLFTYFKVEERVMTREDAPPRISISDDEGNVYDTLGPPEDMVIEEAGPLRTVVRLDGHHTGEAGEFFTYQIRFSFYARVGGIRMSYRWGNDNAEAEFTRFRGIRFELPVAVADDARFTIGADEPVSGMLADGARLEQLYDDRYQAADSEGSRAPGWVSVSSASGGGGLICRNFWQLYPKAIGAENGSLYLDICPQFPEDQYNDCSELDLIKLYYYLQDGRYKVRQGVTKTHDIALGFLPDGREIPPEVIDEETATTNEPPVLTASPDYYASTGVFGDFVPETAGRTPLYDEVCDRVYERYIAHRDSTHGFGMLNYGDQFGERKVNWANGEYDHHHTAAQAFVRSAEARWLHLMHDMARHDIDVDLCHYHTNPAYRGASWVHSMGHTGSYFDKQYQGEWGIPRGGMTVTHTWCEGTCEHYMLTGDPTAIEAARSIADHYDGTYLNHYDFTNGRVPGWHLILTMAVYRTTYDPYYLNAARVMMERVYERRTPGSGWARQLVPGHCHCEPRCRGACSFMQGVLGVGMREYYLETGDERIAEAVVDAARYVIEQMWVEDRECFRYTSCPESSITPSRSDTLAGLLLFAHELSGDPFFSDIAQRSMALGFQHLGSVSHLRWTPYIVYALDRLEREGIGLGGERGASLRLKNDDARPFEVRLCDRDGEGAPPEAAELIGPEGDAYRPDERGRMIVADALQGVYRLRIARGSGPWQVSSSLNQAVLSLRGGVDLGVGERTGALFLRPTAADAEIDLRMQVLEGRVRAQLLSPSGEVLATTWGAEHYSRWVGLAGDVVWQVAAPARGDGFHGLTLKGPGRVRLRCDGVRPWAALSPGRYFNASAPSVTVEGPMILLPGQGRTVTLRAETKDPEDDVVSIRWELPEGRTAEGAELTYQATGENRFQITAIATDAEGNEGATTVEIAVPPAELADVEGLIIVQAEDFAAQGGGEVNVLDRIGDVGKMITMWHAKVGHWLEWEFEVPAEGEYVMYARYASGGEDPRRSLTIDGASPGPTYENIAFEPTGGYCTQQDNWALKKLGPPVHLGAGKHRVRMTNLGDGLAMDYLVITKSRP